MGCLTAWPGTRTCTICGNRYDGSNTWFLLTENCGDNHLTLWKWHAQMSQGPYVHSLCSPGHVRELVVHWMTTGCLHYPFASSPARPSDPKCKPARARPHARGGLLPNCLGEIAVDREAITRALQDNPLSLNTILDELMIALETELIEAVEAEREDTATRLETKTDHLV